MLQKSTNQENLAQRSKIPAPKPSTNSTDFHCRRAWPGGKNSHSAPTGRGSLGSCPLALFHPGGGEVTACSWSQEQGASQAQTWTWHSTPPRRPSPPHPPVSPHFLPAGGWLPFVVVGWGLRQGCPPARTGAYICLACLGEQRYEGGKENPSVPAPGPPVTGHRFSLSPARSGLCLPLSRVLKVNP